MSGLDEETPEAVIAIHEAAHVVVRFVLGREQRAAFSSQYVRLDPTPESRISLYRGRPDRNPTPYSTRRLGVDIKTLLAGPAATAMVGSHNDGGFRDRDLAERGALTLVKSDDAAQRYLARAEAVWSTGAVQTTGIRGFLPPL